MMRACDRWAANDFLARNGLPLEQACGHDPTDCPPHQEHTMTTAAKCLAQYPRRRSDRIIECSLRAGHDGDHYDLESDASWSYAPPTVDERPPPPPAAPTTGAPYGFDLGMSAEQEIRARALALAIQCPSAWSGHHDGPSGVIERAEILAAYIADGSTP